MKPLDPLRPDEYIQSRQLQPKHSLKPEKKNQYATAGAPGSLEARVEQIQTADSIRQLETRELSRPEKIRQKEETIPDSWSRDP
jgi:hypothetical protein